MPASCRPPVRPRRRSRNRSLIEIKNRAIEPQAVVALVTQNTSLITVIGETNNLITSTTGRIPAQPAGEHLLDVITRGRRSSGSGSGPVGDACAP